jgi:hypothetical protein
MQPWKQDMFKIKWDEKAPLKTPDGLSDPKTAVEILEKVAKKNKREPR